MLPAHNPRNLLSIIGGNLHELGIITGAGKAKGEGLSGARQIEDHFAFTFFEGDQT